MSGTYFAGFDLDKVYETEEARVKDQKTVLPKKSHRKTKKETSQDVRERDVLNTSYQDVVFEERAFRKRRQTEKELLTYTQSLARLRKAGFERHARPQEEFSLIIAGLEGKLSNAREQGVYADMFTSYGEWLSLAFERQGDVLVAYIDPEGLVYKNGYRKSKKFSFAHKEDFDITGKQSGSLIDVQEFGDDFVQFLYGRRFAQLPDEMRMGSRRAQVALPSDGIVWPVGRRVFVYGVDGFCNNWASRGVVAAQKISSGSGGGV